MKEFDFDELDKAVSSLMGDVPAAPTDTSDTPAPPVSSKPAALPTNQPTLEQTVDTPSAPVAAKPPATKRAGRFMDVVHPSSDMKTPSQPRREGVAITPPTAPAPEETSTQEPKVSAPEVQPEDSLLPEPDSLATPFLPDAKVEKRPLGSAGPSLDEQMAHELSNHKETPPAHILVESTSISDEKQTITEPAVVVSSKDETNADTQKPAEPDNIALPPELDGDLVAIEAGEKTGLTNTPETEQQPQKSDTANLATSATASSQGSITQQYTEKPSSGDESHAAIFDSIADHPPLAHPKKQKSGWLWVLVIVILLTVGAAAGGAVYFFELI